MGLFSHEVTESELEEGDHVYVYRTPFYAYAHHGIYVGGNKVVHFGVENAMISSSMSSSNNGGGSRVAMTCLNCFLDNGSLRRYEYGVSIVIRSMKRSGTCYTGRSDPPHTVKARALYLLHNGFGNYNLLQKNCEIFAIYCKTGLIAGRQTIYSGQTGSLAFSTRYSPLLFLLQRLIRGPEEPDVSADAPDFETVDTSSAAELQEIPCDSCRRSN